jgi:hypothetical protein
MSCERAGIVDAILAGSFAVRQSKTIYAWSYEAMPQPTEWQRIEN